MTGEELRSLVRAELLEALAEAQRQSGHPLVPLTGDSVPLLDLPGFDTNCGIETSVLLEERLDYEVRDVRFKSPETFRELKVDEIVDAIIADNPDLPIKLERH